MFGERFHSLFARKNHCCPGQFLALASAISLLLGSTTTSIAQLANARQINDNSSSGADTLMYVTNLTFTQVAAAKANGWRYSVLSRILSGPSGPPAQSMAFGDGTRRFYIYFNLNPANQFTVQLLSSSNVTYTLNLFPGDTMRYHLHELIYDPLTLAATYRFDGQTIAVWAGDFSAMQANQVLWGANSLTSGRGEMNYHRAEFSINGLGTVAVYDAGFAGNPATAPSPTTQGWTRVTAGIAIPEIPLSADTEFIHPAAVTGVPTLHPGEAMLNATVNPNGWPAFCWFEHGPTTSYGNVSPVTAVGDSNAFLSTSSLVTGLPRGSTYHFHVVASNNVGAIFGNDASFVVPDSPSMASDPSGGGQAFDIRQPALELNYIICTNGIFPSRDSPFFPPFIGEVVLFAGKFAPNGWSFCDGHLLSISNYTALFSLLGTFYGGDGMTNFALPDLRMRTVVNVGQAPGLQNWDVGEWQGTTQINFTVPEIPAHTHSLPPPYNISGTNGGSQPHQIIKPSLALTCVINVEGYYPLSTQSVIEPFLGEMQMFAGNFGVAIATGQLLPIDQNEALYSIVGTNFGGDGQITFALPDLRGRTVMGVGQGTGLTSRSLAQKSGSENVTMTEAQLPAHQHTVSLLPPFGYVTGTTGSNQPQNLIQPSLALQFLIATNGQVPSTSVQPTNKFVGEIQPFTATTVVVDDWTPCNGQLLSVSAYPDLFSVISNTFGGDGITAFALPDLRGRIPIGSANGQPGAQYGAEQAAMTLAQMPSHTHPVPRLDFDRWISSFGISNAPAAFDADADGDGVPNGFEWATGGNPTNAASANPLLISPAGDTVNIQFNRNTNATDVNFVLQRTADLTNPNGWTGIATNLTGPWIPPAGVIESGDNPVSVSVSDARTNLPAAEYRLKVTWP
jgi:microcystin-dependent protein